MARPPMPIGTHGKITVKTLPGGTGADARCRFRDPDGVTRLVVRKGRTQTAARNALMEALRDRVGQPDSMALSPNSTFSRAAELWLLKISAAVELGDLAPNSGLLYRQQLTGFVLPALGSLRIREVTVPRIDAVLGTIRRRHSAATTKTVRSVISGVMQLAVRHGAAAINPVRHASSIRGDRTSGARALTSVERQRWLEKLEADPVCVRKDLPDLTRWMLATGCRIGETLAVSWNEIDFDAGTAAIEWNLIRVGGQGLVRAHRTKTESGKRILSLPPMALEMLRRRSAVPRRQLPAPVFPDVLGGWRDPSNTLRALRAARGEEFEWVTSHVFRKTCATVLDEAGMTARSIADQLGHARPSLTQDVYIARRSDRAAADVLGRAGMWSLDK